MKDKKTFRNQKLNKEDHKAMDNAAKGVRNGLGIAAIAVGVVAFLKKSDIKTIKEIPAFVAKNFLHH